jgi:hypothetical protein
MEAIGSTGNVGLLSADYMALYPRRWFQIIEYLKRRERGFTIQYGIGFSWNFYIGKFN